MQIKRTKIIATLGPACWSDDKVKGLVEAGADVLRVNTSHLSLKDASPLYERLANLKSALSRPIALLVDLQGPKLRLGTFEPRVVSLRDELTLIEADRSEDLKVPVTIPGFLEKVEKGQKLVLGDGSPVIEVCEVSKTEARAVVIEAGAVRARMGIAFPGGGDFQPLTPKDKEHLELAGCADFVALSFVRRADNIVELKELLKTQGSRARVIAKIERKEALSNLEDIVKVSDAVMVARGDLGVEAGIAHVPFAQKWILQTSQKELTCVITATQVLDSMLQSEQPTRAEVTDIAGAIMDGTSAMMLSEETAVGRYPVHTVATMARLINEIETYSVRTPKEVPGKADERGSLVRAADQLGSDLKVKKLIIPTDTGETARYAAALANQTIFALCTDQKVLSQLSIEKGVVPVLWDGNHKGNLPAASVSWLMNMGWVDPEEKVIVAWGENRGEGWNQLLAALSLQHALD